MASELTLRGKFTADTGYNLAAYAVMALAGVAISLFVATVRSTEALGVFHQIYAVYALAALVAVAGVHDSVQKHVAEHAHRPTLRALVANSSLRAVVRTATATALVLAVSSSWIGIAAASDAVGRGVLLVAPGVWLFAVNKTLLGVLNGLRRMRAFACGQMVRSVLILTGVVGAGLSSLPDWTLAGAFTLAELLLLPVLVSLLRGEIGRAAASGSASWRRKHLSFGLRALPNSLLSESFVRIDVLMLGLLLSDAAVGLYSLAALFVEGIYQVAVVVRTVANPVLVRLVARARRAELAWFCRRSGAVSFAATAVVGVAVYLAFPALAMWLPADTVAESRELLGVLLVGLAVYAAFVPSDHLLLQAGLPSEQSLLMTVNVVAAVGLNLALILHYGAVGAALATAGAYGLSALTLTAAAHRWLGMNRSLFLPPRRTG